MSQAPSYEELKNSDLFWFQATPYIAYMAESLGIWGEDPIPTSLSYQSKISTFDKGGVFPFQELRVTIFEKSEEEIKSLSGTSKYPIGFFQFDEDEDENSVSVTLMCRNELVSRMVATLGMVKSREIQFYITLPVLPNKLPKFYPVIGFEYRIHSTADVFDDAER